MSSPYGHLIMVPHPTEVACNFTRSHDHQDFSHPHSHLDQAFKWKGIMRSNKTCIGSASRGYSAHTSSIALRALQTIFIRVPRLDQFIMAQ